MIRVAIIDDHAIVRMGLKYSLSLEPDFEFVGEHSGGEGAGEFVARVRPDVVLLDVRMPFVNGIDALEDIRRKAPDAKVLMLTTSDGDEDVFRSINKGARGYMVKDESGDDLHVAIRTVASGDVFLPNRIKDIYDDRKMRPSLSEREIEIIRLVAKGFSNDELADRLHLSSETIKVHLRHVYEKLGVESRVEAVTEAMRTGLVEAP
ncbi:MAG: response regulator transcription factor [Lentisphaerae bacterium]|nr:response regulator transcription factor [Lentisphaerota bacterium]